MKITLLQLPVQNIDTSEHPLNTPLKSGYLVGWALHTGRLMEGEWKIVDVEITSIGSDRAIINAATSNSPNIIVFYVYPWNRNRSFSIAQRCAAELPGAHIVATGGEIRESMAGGIFGSILLGEREEAFGLLLDDYRSGKLLKPEYKVDAPIDMRDMPDPWLNKILPIRAQRPMRVLTMRGWSPFAVNDGADCETGTARHCSGDRFEKLLKMAASAGVADIILDDYSLDCAVDLPEYLRSIARYNVGDINLKSRLDPSRVDEPMSRLLKEAHFATVISNLGSTNPEYHKAVKGSFNTAHYERGALALQSRAIQLVVCVALGLPFDSYEHINETFDFLAMNKLGQDSMLEPLAVLPEGFMAKNAKGWGIKAMNQPPYWVQETRWLSTRELFQALNDYENFYDSAWAEPPVPQFSREIGGYRALIDARKIDEIEWMREHPDKLACALTILIDADNPEAISHLLKAAPEICSENPFTLYHLVLHSDVRLPSVQLGRKIQTAFLSNDPYYVLTHSYCNDNQVSFQSRLSFATKSSDLLEKANQEMVPYDLIRIIDRRKRLDLDWLAEYMPFVFYTGSELIFEDLYNLVAIYSGFSYMLLEGPSQLFE